MGFWSKAKHAVIRSKEEQAEYERRKRDKKEDTSTWKKIQERRERIAEREAYEKEREKQAASYGKWKAQKEGKRRKEGGLFGQLSKMAGGSSKRSMPRKSSGKPAKTGKAVKIGGKYYVVDQPKKHKKKKMPRKKNPFDFDFDF